MRLRPILFHAALVALIGSAQAETIDFEDAADFDPGYSRSSSASGGSFAHSASGGAGDPASGGIVAATSGSGNFRYSATRVASGTDLLEVRQWQTTILVNFAALDDHVSGERKGEIAFGLTSGNTHNTSEQNKFFESSSNPGFSLRLKPEHEVGKSDKNRKIEFLLRNRTSTSNTEVEKVSLNEQTAYFNHWLACTLTVTRRGPGDSFELAYRIESLGTDGTSPPTTVREMGPFTVSNAGYASASTLHASFAGNVEKTGSVVNYDDHTFTATRSAPDAPASFTSSAVGEETATVSWSVTSGPGATSQILELSTGDFEADSFVGPSGATGQATGFSVPVGTGSQVFTGLVGGTTYKARMRASNGEGDGPWSEILTIVTPEGNTPPTIDAIPSPLRLSLTTTSRAINLTGITPGAEPAQTVTVTATSSNPAVLPDPNVDYTAPATTGALTLNPTGVAGSAIVTVTLDDGEAEENLTTVQFTVNVEAIPATFTFDDETEYEELDFKDLNVNRAWGVAFGTGDPAGGGIAVGVQNSGGDSGWLAWRGDPFSAAGASYIETSLLFNLREWDDITSGESKGEIVLGLSGDPSQASNSKPWEFLKDGSNTRGLGVKMKIEHKPGEKNRVLELEYQNKTSSSEAGTGGKVTLTATPFDHWMRLTFIAIPNGTNIFSVRYRVEDLGPDGTDDPTLVGQLAAPVTLTNAALATDTSVYPAFAIKPDKNNTRTTYLDDHRIEVQSGPPAAPAPLPATLITGTAFTANWAIPEAFATSYFLEVSAAADHFAPGTLISETGETGQASGIPVPDPTSSSLRLTGLLPGNAYLYRLRSVGFLGTGDPGAEEAVATLAPGENAPPTLAAISDLLLDPSRTRSVGLSGISDGGEGDQTLTVSAVSDDPSLLPHPTVSYTSPDANGALLLSPTGSEGEVTVTVSVSDGGANNATVQRQFLVSLRDYFPTVPFDEAGDLGLYQISALGMNLQRQGGVGKGDPAGGGLLADIAVVGSDGGFAAIRDQSLDASRVASMETSILLHPGTLVSTDGTKRQTDLRLGFASGTEVNPAKPWDFFNKGTNANRSLSVRLKAEHQHGSTDRRFELQFTNKSADGDASTGSTFTATAVDFDQWIRLRLVLTPNGNSFDLSADVEGLGSDGLDAPSPLLAATGSFTNADLAAAPELRGAFTVKPGKEASAPVFFDDHVADSTPDPTPDAPVNFTASDGLFSDRIRLSWNSSPGATRYRISRAVGFDAFSEIGTTTETSYDDFTAARGQIYDYVVVAENAEGIGASSDVDGGYVGVAIPSSISSRYNRAGASVVLSWSAVPGVSRFAVFRSGTGNFADAVEIGTANGLSYEDFAADGGSVYHYWISSIDGNDQRVGGTNAGLRALSGFLQPDLLVGAKPAKLIGGDRYNTNAAEQLLKLKSAKYKPAKVSIQLENDGQFTDSFFYRGSKTTRFFTLTFSRVTPAPANLTAGMASGRAESSLLAVGGSETISVRITPNRKTQKKRSRPYLLKGRLTSESKTESGNLDTVGFDLTSSVK